MQVRSEFESCPSPGLAGRPRAAVSASARSRHKFAATPAAVPGIVDGMTDHLPLSDFGDELGLYRLLRWGKARVRASARPPAERAAILAEIERQYRAATRARSSSATASAAGQGGK